MYYEFWEVCFMEVFVYENKKIMGCHAGNKAAELIRSTLSERGEANIILATGASQFEMLETLVKTEGIDWTKVTMFHLDEYIGIPITHPASFRKYLKERFVDKVGSLKEVFWVNGDTDDPAGECRRLGEAIKAHPIDVAMVGIGENSHLAFNDPPADFEIEDPFIVVTLDEPCRKQQLGEGWFSTFDDVPKQAISMSIKQIMKSRQIIVTVPDERKAKAVKDALEGDISPMIPSSILRKHNTCFMYLDKPAASLLSRGAID